MSVHGHFRLPGDRLRGVDANEAVVEAHREVVGAGVVLDGELSCPTVRHFLLPCRGERTPVVLASAWVSSDVLTVVPMSNSFLSLTEAAPSPILLSFAALRWASYSRSAFTPSTDSTRWTTSDVTVTWIVLPLLFVTSTCCSAAVARMPNTSMTTAATTKRVRIVSLLGAHEMGPGRTGAMPAPAMDGLGMCGTPGNPEGIRNDQDELIAKTRDQSRSPRNSWQGGRERGTCAVYGRDGEAQFGGNLGGGTAVHGVLPIRRARWSARSPFA